MTDSSSQPSMSKMDAQNVASKEKLPPNLRIPESGSIVQVRVIDTNTLLYLNPKLFWRPEIPSFSGFHAPIYCFLISNGSHHVLFDLGVRPDWQNYSPRVVSLIEATTTVTPGSDVSSVLDTDTSGLGIRSTDIEAVIWSHNHFDHIGDVSRFPHSTDLVVGPGVPAASWPGYPSNHDATVLDADAEGWVVREISFDASDSELGLGKEGSLKIGRFDAFDYFGNGSFYLLDAPGHAVGHICGLARTAPASAQDGQPSSFVFMGADACHNLGVLRPSDYLPLPSNVALNKALQVDVTAHQLQQPCLCPGDLLHKYLASPTSPFFTIARGPLFADHDAAADTVTKIQELDAADNVLVLMAHDLSIRDRIPLFPKEINNWRTSGLKTDTRWLFCGDLLPALKKNNRLEEPATVINRLP